MLHARCFAMASHAVEHRRGQKAALRVTDKIRGTYNKATYLEPRRKIMRAWADYLDKIKRGGEVVPMRETISVPMRLPTT